MRAIERWRYRLTTLPYERSLHSSRWCRAAALDLRSTPRPLLLCALNSALHTARSTTTHSIIAALWVSTCCFYNDPYCMTVYQVAQPLFTRLCTSLKACIQIE